GEFETGWHRKTKAQGRMIKDIAFDESLPRIFAEHQAIDGVQVAGPRRGRWLFGCPSRRQVSDTLDAVAGIGMGREKVGHPLSFLFLNSVEGLEKTNRLARVIAGPGAVVDTQLIGFQFVVATVAEEE